ncbi:MAG: hypothetical protein JOY71_06805 [Acetobacteraceae bacterium]|nr:hypothetical protein [Acetobacteraceae bacterium]
MQERLGLLDEAIRSIAIRLPRSRSANRLAEQDRSFHDWYRFILAFPPHLVRTYLGAFGIGPGERILDPFCGTGTTLVEGKKLGCDVVGFEMNPMAHLAAAVKTDWRVNPKILLHAADRCAESAHAAIKSSSKLRALPAEAERLLLRDSICPLPLHKALILREVIENETAGSVRGLAQVALAKALVESASNLHFGPEVGVRGKREDAELVGRWFHRMWIMAKDLSEHVARQSSPAAVHRHDARDPLAGRERGSISAVFTSPPYPNEKDYTRTTRLESVVLGLINNKSELQRLKRDLVRSNTRSVYSTDTDAEWVAGNRRIDAICDEIERRRIALGKTSGFERMYPRVTRLYFGGMARHLASLRPLLKPGAMLGYVVGDQASFLQVMIRTGEILAELAASLGYEVCSVDLFRERFATATRAQMREEVLVLRWPG